MRFSVVLCVLFFFALASVQGQTICSKYSGVLGLNNSALVTQVVVKVFQNLTAGPPLKFFFDGSVVNYPGGQSVNFITNTTYQAVLVQHLVQFFGQALGCNDTTIGPYQGATLVNSHSFMQINNTQFVYFNRVVLGVLASFGVSQQDLQAVNFVLETTRTGACNQPDCTTLCNRYSALQLASNVQLVQQVVLLTVANITAGPPLKQFFDGTVVNYPGGQSVNFITNTTFQGVLVLHLVQFFGQALGCTDGSIGPYQGATLVNSHSFMQINNAQFNYFNQVILGLLAFGGVAPADIAAAAAVLETTRNGVCNQPDCFPATGSSHPSGSASGSASASVSTKAAGSFVTPAAAVVTGAIMLAMH
jgi:truncated hemoglobin YjbI